MKYYLSEKEEVGFNATQKARDDFSSIMSSFGDWQPLEVHRRWDKNRGVRDKAAALAINLKDWLTISARVHDGDVLVIPYPLAMQPKVARTAVPVIRRIKARGTRIVLYIHDLDSIRWRGVYNNDRQFVELADAVIAHNESMGRLIGSWTEVPAIPLGVFDYLYDGPLPPCEKGMDVAGNLSPEKAGWIYEAFETMPSLPLNLYGLGYAGEQESGNIKYMGSFPAEELPLAMRGRFGLVWDGDTVGTCGGSYGDYLKINSPHKLSLYLALGKPVIVWSQAAEASFVQENGTGILVDDLHEALEAYETMDESTYGELRAGALAVSRRVTAGYYTRRAINQALELL